MARPKSPGGIRVALFSPYDGMGMGHLRRNLLIMEHLVARKSAAEVLMISGSHEASVLPVGRGIDHLTIPGLRRQEDGAFAARSMQMDVDAMVKLRSEAIGAPLRSFAPDLFIVDKKPRGVLGELDPLLRALRKSGQTKIVLGLRDVLEDPAELAREWREAGCFDAIEKFYDAVWIYGDPSVYDLASEVGFPAEIRSRIRFTGYLDPQSRLADASGTLPALLEQTTVGDSPFVLCMVGGGEDGMDLADNFSRAELPAGRHGILVAGPFMPENIRQSLHRRAAVTPHLHVLDFLREPAALIKAAERVVCMGGYGAVTEVVSLGKRALIVPRVRPRVEQLIRAERFAELGLVDFLHPDQLSPDRLAAWMARETPARSGTRERIDLGGLERVSHLAAELVGGKTSGRTPRTNLLPADQP